MTYPVTPEHPVDQTERKRREEDCWSLCLAAWLAHREFPQYADAYRGPEWKLVRVLRRVVTKAGLAFSQNEETIAKTETDVLLHCTVVAAYSFHNRVTTILEMRDVEFLTE